MACVAVLAASLSPAAAAVRVVVRLAPLLKLIGGERLIRGRVRRTLVQRSRDRGWVTPEGGSPHPSGVPGEELGAIRAGLARLEIETVPRCGHFIAEEAPEAVAQAVETVLLETAPPPAGGAVSAGPLKQRP